MDTLDLQGFARKILALLNIERGQVVDLELRKLADGSVRVVRGEVP